MLFFASCYIFSVLKNTLTIFFLFLFVYAQLFDVNRIFYNSVGTETLSIAKTKINWYDETMFECDVGYTQLRHAILVWFLPKFYN